MDAVHADFRLVIDFELEPELVALQARVRAFVRDVVIPSEAQDTAAGNGPDPRLRADLQDAAKRAGVFGPQLSLELGGLGLGRRGSAVVLEECGYSLLDGGCQTPLPEPVRTSLKNRASESPSPPFRRTRATDLVPGNASFGGADRDFTKNTNLRGPQALNCAATDEGNMHLLDKIATPAQRERYLVPRADVPMRPSI